MPWIRATEKYDKLAHSECYAEQRLKRPNGLGNVSWVEIVANKFAKDKLCFMCGVELLCHCGGLVLIRTDGVEPKTRGLCLDCDAVRCDAYPGACS